MEIERKYMVKELPDLDKYDRHVITQAYICTDPTIRVRRQDDRYYMTYKGKGLLSKEEYNLPLTKEAYEHLVEKADGFVISKTRYLIPIEKPRFRDGFVPDSLKVHDGGVVGDQVDGLMVELDVFDAPFAPLIMAEVEFPDEDTSVAYIPESWLGTEVTLDKEFTNSQMSKKGVCPIMPE